MKGFRNLFVLAGSGSNVLAWRSLILVCAEIFFTGE